MSNYHVTFNSPWWLLLAALLPALWWFGLRRLVLLGRVRRACVLALRSLVLLLVIFALAEVQTVRTSDRLTVLYLLDQSQSIPAEYRQAMIEYVNKAILKYRRGDDRVGAIVFGRDAAIEVPPFNDDVQMAPTIEQPLDPDFTNLAAAMKLAQALFPEDAAKRIVILSDGNQNLGNALEQAQGLAESGVGIDVIPIRYHSRADVAVQRVIIPSDVRRGDPFDLKVVVSNNTEPKGSDEGTVRGRLIVSRITADGAKVLNTDPADQAVVLAPGKRVFSVRERIDEPNFYTYEARFVPDRPQDDATPQNNRATAFTQVRGKGQVLLIEDEDTPGEFDLLVERLRRQELEVTRQSSKQLFSKLEDLQLYDTVLLANVPRERFDDEQIKILVNNTQVMGAGLVMLGGPNSFGAGGWTGSELERAMPVDFQIKNAKVVPCGALVMIMHASEIAQGNHWQKVIARKAIEALGPQDFCGLIHWNGNEQWLWGRGLLQVGANRNRMLARVDQMTPGDMPEFEPAMAMAQRGFAQVPEAAIKHMIIISDGDPGPPSGQVLNALKKLNVTISTVAVGAHGPAESQLLADIAARGGGKYHAPRNPNALPKIFQQEARRVARPLIWDKFPVQPRVESSHEILSGIPDPLPPIKGFVLTSKKRNPLVETFLISPQPAEDNNTILAGWTYGLGKAAALTTDAGARWTTGWTNLEMYDRLFTNIVRWSMRPVEEAGKFTVATELGDGQVRIIITALDKNDEFLDFLSMSGTALSPGMQPMPFKVEQTAPGRYVGTLPARDPGSYFIMVDPGKTRVEDPSGRKVEKQIATIRTGVNVPYSDEFRERATNEALLGQLAELTPKQGAPGLVIDAPERSQGVEAWLAANTFRHEGLPRATSSQDIWPWLLLVASCLFFFDVFFRRVQVSLAWVPPLAGRVRDRVLRREPGPVQPEFIERLRARKAEVSDRLEQLRAAARFEPPPERAVDAAVLEEGPMPAAQPPAPKPPAPPIAGEPAEEEDSYTARLLRAKKKAWEERGIDD